MAVILDPKPRIRLPSGDVPEPKIARARSWLPFAIIVWVGAVIVAHGIIHGWLPAWSSRSVTPTASAPTVLSAPVGTTAPSSANTELGVAAPPPRSLPSAALKDPDQLPDCDVAVRNTTASESEVDESLPLDLSRSPFGAILESRTWSKPCRASHATRAHLCVAVKDGELLGVTVTTEPSDPSVSKCIVHALSRLALVPDGTLRKVHLTIDLPSDRSR